MSTRRKDREGRSHSKGEQFTKCLRQTMETPAWRALSPVAQAAYPWMKLEWRGDKSNNNGKIFLSVRQLAQRMGIATNTAAKAFHQLQAKGFLVMTQAGQCGVEGEGKSPTYQITELAMPGRQEGEKRYYKWKSGDDFPVEAGAASPRRKTKTRTKSCDDPVSNITTFGKSLC